MKKVILIFAFGFFFLNLNFAQTEIAAVDIPSNNKVEKTSTPAKNFKSFETEILKDLQNKIEYPDLAYSYNVEGTVIVQFIFDGKINDLKILQSVGAGCDETAIKAVKEFPILFEKYVGETEKPVLIKLPFKFEI